MTTAEPTRSDEPAPAWASLNLTLLLAMQVAMQPQKPFLADSDGRAWSFQEAEAAAAHLAGFFADLNIQPGERVALMAPHGPRALIAFLGALRAGLQPLIVPTTLPFADLVAVAAACRPAAIVAENPPGGGDALDAAMRLAAAQSSMRFVMGFGAGLPRGVVDLGQRIEQARRAGVAAQSDELLEATAMLAAQHGGGIATLEFDPLISAGIDIARAARLRSADRLISPLPITDGVGLAAGLIAAVFSGAELAALDAPDTAGLRAALDTPRGRHLVWPARHARLALELTQGRPPLRSFVRRLHGDWTRLQAGRDCDLGADETLDLLAGEDGTVMVVPEAAPAHAADALYARTAS